MSDQTSNPITKVIARAWADPSYQQLLKSDPVNALSQEGIQVPAGHKVQVHQDDETTSHLVLPAKPAGLGPKVDQTAGLVCFSPASASLLLCFYAQRAEAATALGRQLQQHAQDLICFAAKTQGASASGSSPAKNK
jgi:nitrile hydratase alpha subunit